ncbi:MAG: hypothetical protein R6V19_16085 [Armatimonadota bacterium]
MRSTGVFIVLVVFCASAVAQMPQIDVYYDTASDLLAQRMELAEDHYDYGKAACETFSEYARGEFRLTDAEFELQRAIEFGLPPDHPAAQYLRDGVAEVRATMEEWGTDEDETQAAEAWWKRIYDQHSNEFAGQILEWIEQDAMMNTEEAYWMPTYMRRVVIPELEQFKENYPDKAAFAELVPRAGEKVGASWTRAAEEDKDMDCYDWVDKVINDANEAMGQYVLDSLKELETAGKQQIMAEDGEGYPTDAIAALDTARVILDNQPDNAMGKKIHDKAMEAIHAFWDENKFKIEEMRMPADKMPDDTEIHQAMQTAYAEEAADQGWNDQVLRLVVTSDFAESWEAWWIGNTLHAGYFKRITGAVTVQQESGCAVMLCLFRQQRQDDGSFGDMYLGKVIDSYPILEENVDAAAAAE